MFWEIIKTSILSFLVIYLVHNIYCAFFERKRGIPGYTRPSKVRFKEPDTVSQIAVSQESNIAPVDNDMKSELMDFMASSEEKEDTSSAIGVTKLGDLPSDESKNSD